MQSTAVSLSLLLFSFALEFLLSSFFWSIVGTGGERRNTKGKLCLRAGWGFYYYTKTYYYHLSYYIMPDGLTMAFREILRSVETNNEYVFTITLISQVLCLALIIFATVILNVLGNQYFLKRGVCDSSHGLPI
jgi:hypothetical protein